MKAKVITLVIVLTICGCRAMYSPTPQQHPREARDFSDCIQKWDFKSNKYLERVRDKYKYVQKNVIRATTITNDYTPLTFGDFTILDEQVLFASKHNAHIFVDSKFFSTLLVVDVPRLVKEKKEHVVGKFFLLNVEVFPQLIKFLLNSEIISTYRYNKSELCLTQEKITEEYYQAYFNTRRVNDVTAKNEEYYQFSIRVYKTNGQIVVNGA
ncbi:hypothetical protein [Candidatus Uabimicrobium amorphum]|uniref:Lipoprotein n=1 Tax=Uabimicrobium amorphum TaxID=2596890 RepID=A0A5S9ITW8_UABAM|nr:hypothetical protein [Candidatus Uabimicrobium amorphum]BBM88068.1 hypothetical protein UABAM_06484 [Candidatus Uabimicrobium amorphum]